MTVNVGDELFRLSAAELSARYRTRVTCASIQPSTRGIHPSVTAGDSSGGAAAAVAGGYGPLALGSDGAGSLIHDVMNDLDLVVSPAMATQPFSPGDAAPTAIGDDISPWLGSASFTYPCNPVGAPAITVPWSCDSTGTGTGNFTSRWRFHASEPHTPTALYRGRCASHHITEEESRYGTGIYSEVGPVDA